MWLRLCTRKRRRVTQLPPRRSATASTALGHMYASASVILWISLFELNWSVSILVYCCSLCWRHYWPNIITANSLNKHSVKTWLWNASTKRMAYPTSTAGDLSRVRDKSMLGTMFTKTCLFNHLLLHHNFILFNWPLIFNRFKCSLYFSVCVCARACGCACACACVCVCVCSRTKLTCISYLQ